MNPCNVVAQFVTSQPVTADLTMTYMLLVHRRPGPKSDHKKTARIIHSAQRTFAHSVTFPTLARKEKKRKEKKRRRKEKEKRKRENMFLSFYLDGWSVPRRALGNARF